MLPNQIPPAAPEIVALGSALADFLNAIKNNQNALQAAEAALPDLLHASNGIQNIGDDIKKAHNQVYIGWAILQVYESEAPVAPPVGS